MQEFRLAQRARRRSGTRDRASAWQAVFSLATLSLLLPSPVLPQTPARDNPAPAGGTASIRGRVVDAASDRPLSRVEIRANNGSGAQANGLTDGDGRYDLNG